MEKHADGTRKDPTDDLATDYALIGIGMAAGLIGLIYLLVA